MEAGVVNRKITQGLERISKAFRVLLWEESKLYKISPIQIQLLIFCDTHKKENLKVGFLATEFDLTKATVSDSIKVLLKKELLVKKVNPKDSRSFLVELTAKGKKIVKKASLFTSALNESIDYLSEIEKGVFLKQLMQLIYQLNQKNIISTQRMCLTCYHYKKEGNNHYCNLIQKELKNTELQIDCLEHKEL
ncbi:DNA-binding transcriptional regulator, MarR family [Tenacibaculum sp. MAR_2010_89]|uniref:MarR family winged helix-turn-helix transcriptional regulator n=1 Tax=Tenacibaculum sp. MAR_2010_89 TaxID=1250198 RepID=UPI0008991CA4|nr:MarR family winged helix-turn-helix transcriptional regulator [Tenacibaculum sp. MAR_2010_89]SEE48104.1 DNA-binding transcriptional regulator, MarR family [Tenacibaculum sp. MAR_2010_89]